MILESFNSLSIAQSALKTDKITFHISQVIMPSLKNEIDKQVLSVGQISSWTIPDAIEGSNPITLIDFEADREIAKFLEFDERSLTFTFNDA